MLFGTRLVCYGIRLLDAGMDPGMLCVLILYTFGLIIVPRRDFVGNKTYLILIWTVSSTATSKHSL